ncbi:XapX domain-containing protein [Novosphingobium sp. CF614]|uniref:XapX domain-containing protein n=1 Tax=Novosphingobium sp. CF614 TaxID=1884364 RepID=UPI0008EE8D8A|nr:XapX domain-containing protein [Novosphingobium sp. CF614]SFG49572.1 XapX domain-containing protein [Novosphingobium sp. CF614]
MKLYLLSLGAGLLVGIVYSLLGVRSPAPPIIALVGLLGILAGEQIVPIAKRLLSGPDLLNFVQSECRNHMLGELPSNQDRNA